MTRMGHLLGSRALAALLAFFAGASATRVFAQEIQTGPDDASVSIVEYADFSAEGSARISFMIKALADAYPSDIRVVFKNSPRGAKVPADVLAMHDAALAALPQGKFWEMSDLIFANQQRRTRADFIGMAGQLGLDVARYTRDFDAGMSNGDVEAIVTSDRTDAEALRISTPACTINGQVFTWPVTLDQLKAAARQWMRQAK